MSENLRIAKELYKTRGGDKELKSIRRRQKDPEEDQIKVKEDEINRREELSKLAAKEKKEKKKREKSFSLSRSKKTGETGITYKTRSGEEKYTELVPGKKVETNAENSEDDYGPGDGYISGYGSGPNYDEPEEYDEVEIPEKGPGKGERTPTIRSKTQSIQSERGNPVSRASGSRSGRKEHGSTGYASSITTGSTLTEEKPEKLLLGWKDGTARQSVIGSDETRERSGRSSHTRSEGTSSTNSRPKTEAEKEEFAKKLRDLETDPEVIKYRGSTIREVPPSVASSQLSKSTQKSKIRVKNEYQTPQSSRTLGSQLSENTETSAKHKDREHKDREHRHKDREHRHKDREHRSKEHELPSRIKDTERKPHRSSTSNASGSKASSARSSTTKSSRTTSRRDYDEESDSGSETPTEDRSRDKRSFTSSRKSTTASEYYSAKGSPTRASEVSRSEFYSAKGSPTRASEQQDLDFAPASSVCHGHRDFRQATGEFFIKNVNLECAVQTEPGYVKTGQERDINILIDIATTTLSSAAIDGAYLNDTVHSTGIHEQEEQHVIPKQRTSYGRSEPHEIELEVRFEPGCVSVRDGNISLWGFKSLEYRSKNAISAVCN